MGVWQEKYSVRWQPNTVSITRFISAIVMIPDRGRPRAANLARTMFHVPYLNAHSLNHNITKTVLQLAAMSRGEEIRRVFKLLHRYTYVQRCIIVWFHYSIRIIHSVSKKHGTTSSTIRWTRLFSVYNNFGTLIRPTKSIGHRQLKFTEPEAEVKLQ